jgi:TPR repeat protein
VPAKPPGKPAVALPGAEEAAKRYREGQALERKGDEAGALKAYLEAAEAGNGPAQRRLGQIYDKGNSAVQRDYQASLKWYQKAREQGIEIDKPLPRMSPSDR